MSVRSLLLTLLLAAAVITHGGEEGFQPLFDGESFDGWTGMRGNLLPSQSLVIEDGMIRTQKDRSRGDLRTVAEYSDFDFRFEWKIAEKGNSGVKYNVHEEWTSDRFRPSQTERQKARIQRGAVGFEYQILDDTLWDCSLDDWRASASGALYLIHWSM